MSLKLYMVLLGSKPEGRNTEQHDIFFGIAESLAALLPEMNAFWPEAKGKMHIDGWREVTQVGDYSVTVVKREAAPASASPRLFFINLGGYKPGEFEEFHYKMIVAANDKGEAVRASKATAFYKHTGFEGAKSHVDDKYGVDVDDVAEIEDILSPATKKAYSLVVSSRIATEEDPLHLGYLKFEKLL